MNPLARLSTATTALAEAKNLDDILPILNLADAARTYAKAAKLGLEAQNHAAEIQLRAARKAGQILQTMKKNGELDKGGRPSENRSRLVIGLSDLGVKPMQSHRWQKVADVPEELFETQIATVPAQGKELTTAGMLKIAKASERNGKPDAMGSGDGSFDLLHSPIESLILPADSVDAIVTDPPYPQEYLPLFSVLSDLAAHVLKPGGSLFVMVGQSYLPEVICRLSEKMCYHWTLAYMTPGGQAVQLWQRKVNTFWKPILWFTKGDYTGSWLGDVANSKVNDNDKRFHGWGQSESGMIDLLQRCSEPLQTILDPFCGGGATGVAALATGRHFIGADKEAECIETCRSRLVGMSHADVQH